jgi:hypothetical protein
MSASTAKEYEEELFEGKSLEELEALSKDTHYKPKPVREKYLKQRIESTKASIAALEKEQRKRPDDPAVKKALQQRREYLRKYMDASATGEY